MKNCHKTVEVRKCLTKWQWPFFRTLPFCRTCRPGHLHLHRQGSRWNHHKGRDRRYNGIDQQCRALDTRSAPFRPRPVDTLDKKKERCFRLKKCEGLSALLYTNLFSCFRQSSMIDVWFSASIAKCKINTEKVLRVMENLVNNYDRFLHPLVHCGRSPRSWRSTSNSLHDLSQVANQIHKSYLSQ